MVTENRLSKLKRVLKCRQPDLTVVFENIHDPHNVSAILRTCDAAGILETYQIYTDTQFPKLGKKSSSSAKKWIKQKRYSSYHKLRADLAEQDFRIFATTLSPGAKSIYSIDWLKPSAIILGNEHKGVSDDALQIADERIYIPQFGMVKSLNVSVAAAVILYEAVRQRLSAGYYTGQRLSEDRLKYILEDWINK